MNKTSIRTYVSQDLDSVLELHERCLDKTTHIAVDENFLRYFITSPGVEEDGIFIAERKGDIIGFAVISTQKQKYMHAGKIILFVSDDTIGAQELLEAAERYCLDKGVDLLMAVPPSQLAPAFRKKNWDKYIHSSLVARGIRLIPLLQAVTDDKKNIMAKSRQRNIILVLEDEAIQVSNRDDRWIVERIDQIPQGIPTMTAQKKALLNILFGNKNPFLEYMRGKIKIKPTKNIFFILRFLHNIKIDLPIYASLADKI
jgi:hypothetical protein